ncbi:MAG: geranylgeranylglycerol-phosphate geranylgeranyltransferase [Bacteroidetes bacterium]|nr:geranylgeranylglycerol-phosphate geranylgeranyltransferase [Bacteroidota bacterium]
MGSVELVVAQLLNNKIIAFFKLVRIENLVMIALTQFLLRYFVLQKVMNQYGMGLELGNSLFHLIVISTLLIAAAGYIINDYFDVKTDMINRPDTVVVDKAIKRRWAIILHITFTFLGIVIGMYASLKAGYLRLSIFHFGAAILLWFYSTHLKKQLLVGNIAVSLLMASVSFMPLVFEMGMMQKTYPHFFSEYTHAVLASFKIIFIFSLFSFITGMAREIIKDMEDYKGDKATGSLTMPIVWGIRSSKLIACFCLMVTAMLLSFVVYNTIKTQRSVFSVHSVYITLTLILPALFLALYTFQAHSSKQFKRASLILKFIMLMGLCYSFIFYYN